MCIQWTRPSWSIRSPSLRKRNVLRVRNENDYLRRTEKKFIKSLLYSIDILSYREYIFILGILIHCTILSMIIIYIYAICFAIMNYIIFIFGFKFKFNLQIISLYFWFHISNFGTVSSGILFLFRHQWRKDEFILRSAEVHQMQCAK